MADRRNILMVVFDSLSAVALEAMSDRLPVLSGLRKCSVRFTNAYAPSPEGGPARASLFTGLDMAAHGVWTDGVALPEHEVTLPQRLAETGYRTWLVGRRHLAGLSHWTTEHARPFEYAHLDWAHGPLHRSRQNAYLDWLQTEASEIYAAIFPHQPDPDETAIPEAQRAAMAALPDRLSFNTWVGDRVCEQLSRRERPFLGMAGFVTGVSMGAAPVAPCEALCEPALRQADAALGAILRKVESEGLSDSTAVLVCAARGAVTEGDALMCEAAIRVPLMLVLPGQAARTVTEAVSTIDIAPTVHSLAGVPAPRRVQGACLLGDPPRGWAMSRLRHPDHGWQTALRDGEWKLVMSHGDPDRGIAPGFRLYDLRDDPAEARDLSGTRPDDLEALIDRMIDARAALEDRTEPRIAKF